MSGFRIDSVWLTSSVGDFIPESKTLAIQSLSSSPMGRSANLGPSEFNF
jgi:hypothetical protein